MPKRIKLRPVTAAEKAEIERLAKARSTVAVDYWNRHAHPYVWKKRPQEQAFLDPIGAFAIACSPVI